jgi:hypothetical protein
MRWYILVIPAHRSLRQENLEFKANLSYIATLPQKEKKRG